MADEETSASGGRQKSPQAFRTIREVSNMVGVQPHVLRFWESRFKELRPLQRAEGGNRRYYRPADVALVKALHRLLHQQGYKVEGVQKLLAAEGAAGVIRRANGELTAAATCPPPELFAALTRVRDQLRQALAA